MTETLVLAVRVTVSLALVLALLWFLSRRLGAGTGATRRLPITVLGRQTLGRRAGVAVVDVAGRTLVLGVSDAGVRLLTELESGGTFELPDDVAPAEDEDTGSATPLSGSVLAPESWRASWQTLRRRTRP